MRLLGLLLLSLFGTSVSAQRSEAILTQVGAFNIAAITQFASVATLKQTGSANMAQIQQAAGSTAEIVQSGEGNVLAGFGAFLGPADLLSAAFQADASILMLSQNGTGNQAFVHQDTGAYAHITQSGTGNRVTLVQRGVF